MGSFLKILPQSKIVNNASVGINGTLSLILQRKGLDIWKDYKIVSSKEVNIPSGGLIKLDIGKGFGWNLKNISADESGKYRVFAKFNNTNGEINATWEFNAI